MIVKRKNEYCLLTKDGSRTLGCHPTRALATKQEAAVMASKAAAAKGSEQVLSFVGKDGRESAALRGYDAKWRKIRAEFLAKHEVCNYPGCKKRATDADHILGKPARLGGLDSFKNLQPRCHMHHSKKTAGADGGFGNPKKKRENKTGNESPIRAGQPRHPKAIKECEQFWAGQARHPKGGSQGGQFKGGKNPKGRKGIGGGGGKAANQKEWEDGLSKDESSAIKAYTGEDAYRGINSNLRNDTSLDSEQGKIANNLNSALDRAPNPPPPAEVYRGLMGEGAATFSGQLKEGDTLKLKGFQSTTLDRDLAEDFTGSRGDVLLVIRPKSGGFLGNVSANNVEEEFLIGHKKKFKVDGIKKNRITIVTLTED